MGINGCRFTYILGVLDCLRPIVEGTKKRPAKPQPVTKTKMPGQPNTGEEEKDSADRVDLIYACAAGETEKRDLSVDLPAHWLAR